jgi:hypothetical protein
MESKPGATESKRPAAKSKSSATKSKAAATKSKYPFQSRISCFQRLALRSRTAGQFFAAHPAALLQGSI